MPVPSNAAPAEQGAPATSTLTTMAGAPVPDNQHSETAGRSGPVLLQDHHLLEKLAHFNRERIPERVVHAVGIAAGGVFEVTQDVTKYTRAAFLSEVGKQTEVFARFSTVAGSQGAPDTARDPRGFALKFYTEEGNYDLVGNNTPIFFIRDPLKFPDFIHTQKPDPRTKVQEPDNVWDFFSLSPELTHQFTWLFGDRGRPATVRHMDGFRLGTPSSGRTRRASPSGSSTTSRPIRAFSACTTTRCSRSPAEIRNTTCRICATRSSAENSRRGRSRSS